MASITIKAECLSVGDVLLLPMGRTATIEQVFPVGHRTRYVRFKTEFGRSRVEVGTPVQVQAKAL